MNRCPFIPAASLRAVRLWGWLLVVLCCCRAGAADQPPPSSSPQVDLTELSLEELMDVQVTSVSKRAEPIYAAAAAVFVITQEDLRRSGVTSIPEALRMVPGLEVARIDANKWAVSARGFNGRFANKLLVLIDGRSVYTPLFSGVYWDVQDTLLEDIDRIEVIRGPGATLWGANAVNGVINIITRSARETQGGLLAAGGGSEERGFAALRYGGALGESSFYRLYAKAFERDGGERVTGEAGADDWSMRRGGFRLDSQLSGGGDWMVTGELYDGEAGETLTLQSLQAPLPRTVDSEEEVSGGYLLSRWQRALSETSELKVQLYYDRTERLAQFLDEDRDTFDVEVQHGFSPGRRHRLLWGLGFRRTADDLQGAEILSFSPTRRTDDLASGFLQDEITLRPDRLWLTLGSKVEHNDYTGLEVQPNLRAVWLARPHHTLWAAASRAVRTPSRAEDDLRLDAQVIPPGQLFPGSPVALLSSFGSRDFRSEELLAWELGYRAGLSPGLFLDLATFYNVYDRLRSASLGEPFLQLAPRPHLVVPVLVGNDLEGDTYGAELAADWRVSKRWRWSAAYTFLSVQLQQRSGAGELGLEGEGQSPQHQLFLRSSLDLARGVELDFALRYVDELEGLDVDRYATFDLRLGWRPRPDLELSLVGQNLLEDGHFEAVSEVIPAHSTAVERGVYGKVEWRF
ncbi:MAG TPA: TonB-dependent receptor [Thermoanaerobaculia bacterium]|nr:TonB-dependent receptor [Thermoanaerobaculia bacterium]